MLVSMTRIARPWIVDDTGTAVWLSRRCHGSLETVTDSERRALRPIGTTAQEVASRTGDLLAELLTVPGVRIFQGVRPAAVGLPRIPHAVSSGRQLVLVESVAWPAGQYSTTPAGRIHCDGTYIGQSVRPLIAAIRRWREALPPGHRVSAVVVVHPASDGDLVLPGTAGSTLGWACATEAMRRIREQLPRGQQPTSVRVVAALVAATAEEECEWKRAAFAPGDQSIGGASPWG
jgi:hypothetical protein